MKVGVLALQGDVREHISSLITCGVDPVAVRRSAEIDAIDALVLPGGESTTIAQLSEVFGIYEQLKDRIANGMPVYGSCAGMILLANEILDAKHGQKSFGGLDITVRRNAFGRQVDSFESDIAFDDGSQNYFALYLSVHRGLREWAKGFRCWHLLINILSQCAHKHCLQPHSTLK